MSSFEADNVVIFSDDDQSVIMLDESKENDDNEGNKDLENLKDLLTIPQYSISEYDSEGQTINNSTTQCSFEQDVTLMIEEEYMNDIIRGKFTQCLKNYSETLRNGKHRKKEVDKFLKLLSGFESSYPLEFIVHENYFDLNHSDLYINVIVKNLKFVNKTLEAIAKHLQGKGIIQNYIFEKSSYRKKLIFHFGLQNKGTIDFVIKANNHIHQSKDLLITTYAKLDERFVVIASFMNYWAFRRGLFKNERILNPHILYFMVIYFLMVQDPPSYLSCIIPT